MVVRGPEYPRCCCCCFGSSKPPGIVQRKQPHRHTTTIKTPKEDRRCALRCVPSTWYAVWAGVVWMGWSGWASKWMDGWMDGWIPRTKNDQGRAFSRVRSVSAVGLAFFALAGWICRWMDERSRASRHKWRSRGAVLVA
ncbi:uncharacterized protein BJ171DRAFT_120861 [Polychytrium aggregatum]|uniref:uncharacterized protein n=1 Tax=Polychytrium aggregatum TaxID=110093 RepID=UPI0022FE2723|nr:uncharacterized protein BJ171DRAFT_120861 [Polychytrium aggregatum]KAI9204204.1 hypothetical protein BJ171DRAFT_120861 [Polychytrium aggregatum]